MKRMLVVVLTLLLLTLFVSAQKPSGTPGAGGCQMMKHQGPEMMGGRGMEDFLEDLKLTPDQQTKITDLKFAHQQEILPLKRDLTKKRIELKSELEKESPNKATLEKLTDEISVLQAKVQKSKLNFLLSLKTVLTPEQWQKAKENFLEEKGGRLKIREERRQITRDMPPPMPPSKDEE
jgi:Spy/CpxP family protein refolding chaperone